MRGRFRRRRRGRSLRRPVLVGLAVVVIAFVAVAGWYLGTQRHIGKALARGERTNILLLGLDNVEGSSRSDTMMVVSVASGKDVTLLSVPRDLRVKLSDGHFHKLNAAYGMGGVRYTAEAVSNLLGVSIPYHIALDYEGFKKLIDQIGGVVVTVEQRMVYDDNRATPPLHISIQPGQQVMDGKTALDYIRFRDDITGDIGRIGRQQKLISALLQKGLQDKSLGAIRALVDSVRSYLKTNLSAVDFYELAKLTQGITAGQLRMATVPGTPVTIDNVSYLEPQAVAMEQLVSRLLKGMDVPIPAEINVAVFNGNGVKMVASETSKYLTDRGFRVSGTKNAEVFTYDKTYIVVLTDPKKAQVLQDALPSESTILTREQFSAHYAALAPSIPTGTDLVLVAGAGFALKTE